MKAKYLALALPLSASLVADDCCTGPARPNICSESYTPAFHNLNCDWGVFVYADFLYWYGTESDLTYAERFTTVNTVNPVSTAAGTAPFFVGNATDFLSMSNNWNPGVRVGLGLNLDDGWDLDLNWTYYSNNKKNSQSVDPFNSILPPLGEDGFFMVWNDAAFNPTGTGSLAFNDVSAKWNLVFDQVDLVMGRHYWLSSCFTMRPYAGLRGAWAHTNFNVSGTSTAFPRVVGGSFSVANRFKNNNWGVGLIAGFQPTFYFADCFSMFANADIALLWGKAKEKISRSYTSNVLNGGISLAAPVSTTLTTGADVHSGMQPVLDLALGLRWETTWCDNSYGFSLDAGWEHHVWFDYFRRTKFNIAQTLASTAPNGTIISTSSASTKFEKLITNLDMGGFVLRARFDF